VVGTHVKGEDMTQQSPDPVQQEVLGALARWLVNGLPTEPGWDELHLQLRPLRDEVSFRVVEVRGEERGARLGRLTPDQPPHTLARRLQDLAAVPGKGTWIEASLTLAATGWPSPTFTVTARFNHDSDPAPWREGDAPLDATDLVHHLTRYPRREDAVPAWMAERITAAGLSVPPYADEGAPTTRSVEGAGPAAVVPDGGEQRRLEAVDRAMGHRCAREAVIAEHARAEAGKRRFGRRCVIDGVAGRRHEQPPTYAGDMSFA